MLYLQPPWGVVSLFIKGNNPINNNDWQAINYDYGTAQFNMGYGVYVSPTAAPFQKTVYIHQTYFGLLTNGMNSAVTRSFDLNLPSVNCTLNVPAVVDFGSVTSDAETAAKASVNNPLLLLTAAAQEACQYQRLLDTHSHLKVKKGIKRVYL